MARLKVRRPESPWPYVAWLVVGLAALSYSRLNVYLFVSVFLAGVVWPAWRADAVLRAGAALPRSGRETLPAVRPGFVLFLLAAAVAVRFFRLTTLSAWPLFDEGVYSYAAIEMIQGAPPILFYGNSQAPPSFFWALAVLYRCFGVSLGGMWFLPALFSLIFVPLAWWAARKWYSPSASAFIAGLAALSFWPMYLGRFSVMTITLLPLMALAFGALGAAFSKNATWRSWLSLGVVLGAGFYTHLHWLAVAPVLAVTAGWVLWKRGRISSAKAAALVVPLVLLPMPLVVAALKEGFGTYLAHLWAIKPSMRPLDQLDLAIRYVGSLFWGVDPEHCTYQPVWGGFLNPVLGALFLLGIAAAVRRFREGRNAWLLAAFVLWLMPGLLTKDLETFRLVPVMPVLFVLVWEGLSRLLGGDPTRNLRIVLAVAALSFALDANHLFNVYAKRWDVPRYWTGHSKSLARARAFSLLEAKAHTQGPGLVYTRFVPGLPDPTLEVAVYEFNAVDNPAVKPYLCRWAAFLVNTNYEGALKQAYPFGRGFPLDTEGVSPDGGWTLFITPLLDGKVRQDLEAWTRVHREMTPYWRDAMNYVYGTDYARYLPALENAFGKDLPDPLLTALRAEIESDALFKSDTLAARPQEGVSGKPFGRSVQALSKALQTGPPFAHLYYRLGHLHLIRGEGPEARRAFESATRCPVDRTRSRDVLATLTSTAGESRKREP